jgi:predicted membrane-bound spermidine synthase
MNIGGTKSHRTPLSVLFGIFLVSFAGLTLQVTLTRIFSTTIWYHYAFVAVSVALFGWGFGGIILHFLKQKDHIMKLNLALAALLLFSASMPIYLISIASFRFTQAYISFYYAISLVPFLLAGTFMAFFYSEHAESANRLYLADLVGASFAGLTIEPILSFLGAESTILLIGVIGSFMGIVLATSLKKRKAVAIGLVFLIANSTLFVVNTNYGFINVSYGFDKSMYRTLQGNSALHVSFTRWNSFSRVDAVEGFQGQHAARIFIDADASTDVLRWDGRIESLEYFKDTMDFLPYYLVKEPKTLVIGPGGGQDVLVALLGNSSRIVAVELNPLVIDAVQRYSNETADIYNNPRVELHIDEGRSFIKRSTDKFDAITLTLVDSWASISTGGYALAENYLYTKEAFMDYLNHLADNGVLIMIRWEVEVPRLVSTIAEAFSMLGEEVQDLGKHLGVVRYEIEPGRVRTLLTLKKSAFTSAEAEMFLEKASTLGPAYNAFYVPYVKEDVEPYRKLFNGSISLAQFYNEFPYRVDAVSDDSPYHFNLEKTLPKPLSDLTIVALSLTLLSIVIPWAFSFWWKKRRNAKSSDPDDPIRFSLVPFIVFFSALGVGYMLLEIALIQKFILFLGYPTRALAVILFSLLLSSGIGSFVSGQLASRHKGITKTIFLACLFIILIALIYVFSLSRMFELWLSTSSSIRTALTIVLIFPIGFFMGMPFPSGLRMLHASSDENIPWIWGINGAMSVLGSILATIIGIFLGFNLAILFGATAYLVALLCAIATRPSKLASSG